mmetsp:Transcript_24912/g.61387  ORF Transcript_24912/g.61387 Transcript_24912/m.61387 type:complete len:387 (-) Transcript_24912:71-1231(-)|eukprot:CAMPEP_0197590698 /NCGR_PEP_ID=MMETSP1326-20131121/12029_1 /TAXON_ID=1155430 /ORGANISM="Genus nov. species nov., Strain RCC2288" /LENGTH=386 /DNA_ID=CAMNT_0043155921 /DNA_START=344 /DNA_END=1504 /DNA_ORIENTATION=+
MGTAGAGLVGGAVHGALGLVLAEVLRDAGVVLLLADALLPAGHLVALATLDGGAQAGGLGARGGLAQLAAVLRGLLHVAGAVLRAAVAQLAAPAPGAVVAPHAVHRALLAEAGAHLSHVAAARGAAGEAGGQLGGAALVVVVAVENSNLACRLGGAGEVAGGLRGDLHRALAVLHAVLPARGVALAPLAPRGEHAVYRARPVPGGEAGGGVDGGGEGGEGSHAGADVAQHLVVVGARGPRSLEQRVGSAVGGALRAGAVQGLEGGLHASTPGHTEVAPERLILGVRVLVAGRPRGPRTPHAGNTAGRGRGHHLGGGVEEATRSGSVRIRIIGFGIRGRPRDELLLCLLSLGARGVVLRRENKYHEDRAGHTHLASSVLNLRTRVCK